MTGKNLEIISQIVLGYENGIDCDSAFLLEYFYQLLLKSLSVTNFAQRRALYNYHFSLMQKFIFNIISGINNLFRYTRTFFFLDSPIMSSILSFQVFLSSSGAFFFINPPKCCSATSFAKKGT